jgi:hypothetical protein
VFVWWAGAAAEAASPTDDCCSRRDRKRADERRLKGTLTPEKPCLRPGGGRGGNGPLSLRDLPSVQDGRKILPDPGARARNLAIGTTEPPGRAAKPNGGFFFFMGSAILRQGWAPGCSFVTAATSVEHHSQSGERLAMRETQETGMWRCGATRLAYCLSSVASGQSG